MAKQIARLLKTNMMADIDMPALAQFLQSQGRRGDSVLAHINPKEAMLLQKMGGAGTENPATGLPEFYRDDGFSRSYGEDFTDNFYDSYMSRQRPIEEAQRYSDLASSSRPRYEEVEPPRNIFSGGLGGRFAAEGQGQTIDVPDYGINRQRDFDVSPVFREFTEPQTINTDYLNAINLSGSGRFSQVPELEQFAPSVDTELAAAAPTEAAADKRNIFRRGIDSLKEITGLSGEELARLGLAGGLGIQGAMGARRMAEQGQEARREQEAIAAPYRERGAALLAEAEGGQLTPQAQQSLQAMRARLQQGVESRGGVGAQQAAAQVEAFRQQLLGNQFDYGMKISNIGDQIAMGAIRTGLEADRYASQMTNSYFTNMARLLAGMGGETEDAVTQSTEIRGAR